MYVCTAQARRQNDITNTSFYVILKYDKREYNMGIMLSDTE